MKPAPMMSADIVNVHLRTLRRRMDALGEVLEGTDLPDAKFEFRQAWRALLRLEKAADYGNVEA